MTFARPARVDDVVVELTCVCGTVLVAQGAVDAWRCPRRHRGTPGRRFRLHAEGWALLR